MPLPASQSHLPSAGPCRGASWSVVYLHLQATIHPRACGGVSGLFSSCVVEEALDDAPIDNNSDSMSSGRATSVWTRLMIQKYAGESIASSMFEHLVCTQDDRDQGSGHACYSLAHRRFTQIPLVHLYSRIKFYYSGSFRNILLRVRKRIHVSVIRSSAIIS